MGLAARFGYFSGRFKHTRAVNRSRGGLHAGPPDLQAAMQPRRDADSLLVIAPRVPGFDRQSGDLRLYSLLKILSRHYRIHFVAQGVKTGLPQGGQEKYENALKELGITVYARDFSLREILGKTRFRAAWIEFFNVAEYFLPRIRLLQPKCRLIIDTVDVHYARLHSKWLVSRDPKDLKRSEETKARELAIYRKADSLIMITEEDREVLQGDGVEVPCFLIPNIHDVVPGGSGSVNDHSLVFVGGFAHEPNTDAVLFFCREIFPLIRAKVPDATFTVIGSDPPEAIRALQSDSVRVTGHVPSTTPYLLESRISVAPLRFGAGMKGKIGEAMAHGLPVVTTSVGASGMHLSDRENAMIADTAGDFANSVVELLRDRDLQERIRRNALDHVRKSFSTSHVEKLLLQVLGSLDGISSNPLRFSENVSFLMDYFRDRCRAAARGRSVTPK
jgi:glycosyltransferase involved in cell wall biosynthesis